MNFPSPGFATLPMNRPTPNPSQQGSRAAGARPQFPSWEGLRVGSGTQIADDFRPHHPLPTRCDGAPARRVRWGEGRGEGLYEKFMRTIRNTANDQ